MRRVAGTPAADGAASRPSLAVNATHIEIEVIAMSTAVRHIVILTTTIGLIALTPVTAVAAPPRDPAPPETVPITPYAEPLAALDGRTLAEYLADYRWADPRLQ